MDSEREVICRSWKHPDLLQKFLTSPIFNFMICRCIQYSPKHKKWRALQQELTAWNCELLLQRNSILDVSLWHTSATGFLFQNLNFSILTLLWKPFFQGTLFYMTCGSRAPCCCGIVVAPLITVSGIRNRFSPRRVGKSWWWGFLTISPSGYIAASCS